LFLVGIHFGEQHFAAALFDLAFENGGERDARSAPRRPEIDDHCGLVRFLDDFLFELGLGDAKNPR